MPRPGIDWSTLHTLEERIAALLEDTDLSDFRLLVNPSDEAEAKKILKKAKADVKVSTNGAVDVGSPMLEGIPSNTRTTTAGDPQKQYEPEDIARLMWKAMQQEGKTYPDYKGARLPKTPWDELTVLEQHVFVGGVQRLLTERVITPGVKGR